MPARPHVKVTPELIAQIEAQAARGLTMEQIANVLGFNVRTLHRKQALMSEVADAIKRGQAKGLATVTNNLFALCKDKNLGAIIFYLKCRGGKAWMEKQLIEHTGADGAPMEVVRRIVDPREPVKDDGQAE